MSTRPVIVGIGETEFFKRGASPHSELALALTAVQNACRDAGLEPQAIDGVASFADNRVHGLALQSMLGMPRLRHCSMVWGGGGGGACGALASAAAAVECGRAEHVLVLRSVSQANGRLGAAGGYTGGGVTPAVASGLADIYCHGYTQPYGLMTPGQLAALHFQRYMHEHGVGSEALGHVAVTFRDNAQRNPRAVMKKPMTLEDHANARLISQPYRLFDFCLESDGACALIITTEARAKALSGRAVRILARAEGSADQWAAALRTPFPSNNQGWMAQDLYREAGLAPADIDVAQIYDNFSGQVLIGLEEWGLCKPGQAADFVSRGGIRRDGELPLNTAGGMLSEGYIQGLNLVTEAVRQIRGESTTQVAGAEKVLVTGGSMAAPSSAAILGA